MIQGAERQPYNKYRCMTIRSHQVKRLVTYEDINEVLKCIIGMGWNLHWIGFHIHGKYRQLHCHALFSKSDIFIWPQKSIRGFFVHVTRLKDPLAYSDYIHSEDHKSLYRLDQMEIENYYNYHFYDQDIQEYIPL